MSIIKSSGIARLIKISCSDQKGGTFSLHHPASDNASWIRNYGSKWDYTASFSFSPALSLAYMARQSCTVQTDVLRKSRPINTIIKNGLQAADAAISALPVQIFCSIATLLQSFCFWCSFSCLCSSLHFSFFQFSPTIVWQLEMEVRNGLRTRPYTYRLSCVRFCMV